MNLGRLPELLQQFPGVGKRQADRFAYFLVKRGPVYARDLLEELAIIQSKVRVCTESFQLFQSDDGATTAPLVRDLTRHNGQYLLVEKDFDIEPLERAGYKGQYLVLGGLLPMVPTKKTGVRFEECLEKINQKGIEGKVTEVIIGLSWTPEAEHTKDELLVKLDPLSKEYNFTISSLGRGLSTGSELEYADSKTLEFALQKRV